MKVLLFSFLLAWMGISAEKAPVFEISDKMEKPQACPKFADLFVPAGGANPCAYIYVGPTTMGSVNGSGVNFLNGGLYVFGPTDVIYVVIPGELTPCGPYTPPPPCS